MINFKIKRTLPTSRGINISWASSKTLFWVLVVKDEGATLGTFSRAVHTICLHPRGRLPAEMTLPCSSILVHAPRHQDTETTLLPLKSGLALWLALAKECGHTVWFLSLGLKSLPASVFFFAFMEACCHVNKATVLLERGHVRREELEERGSAQLAPGCSSCPSWGARHVSEAIL